jgi:hypothetical protein
MSSEKPLTYEEILAQLPAARARAKAANRTQPRARSATFDAATRRVRIELKNGCAFEFPADLAQGLRGVPAEVLAQVEIFPGGRALRWDALDVDFSVPGLVAGRFGGKAWMRQLESEMADKKAPGPSLARTKAGQGGTKRPRPRKVDSDPAAAA